MLNLSRMLAVLDIYGINVFTSTPNCGMPYLVFYYIVLLPLLFMKLFIKNLV